VAASRVMDSETEALLARAALARAVMQEAIEESKELLRENRSFLTALQIARDRRVVALNAQSQRLELKLAVDRCGYQRAVAQPPGGD
jgi:hypothetical protein